MAKHTPTFTLTDDQESALAWGLNRDGLGSIEDFTAQNIASVADSYATQRDQADTDVIVKAIDLKAKMDPATAASVDAAIAMLKQAVLTVPYAVTSADAKVSI